MSKRKKVTIYTDSRDAFATLHIQGALYWDRGLLTAKRKDIKNKEEILILLDAVWSHTEVAVMHCHGHQKEDTPQAGGNSLLMRPPDRKGKKSSRGQKGIWGNPHEDICPS